MTQTPEERARKIVRDLFYDTEWDNLVSYGADAIATAIREAIAEREKQFSEAMNIHLDTAIRDARNAALEEAAKICDEQSAIFLSDTYATHQPISSINERFACGQIKEAILALKDKPE
jgi:hypothetical protein